jgi:hypothetical protein
MKPWEVSLGWQSSNRMSSTADLPMKFEQELVHTTSSNAADGEEPVVLDSSVRRKVDIRLIPLMTILYLCCFLCVPFICRDTHLPNLFEIV